MYNWRDLNVPPVSNSIAENKKPPSPDTENLLSLPGSTKVAAIAQGSATPNVFAYRY